MSDQTAGDLLRTWLLPARERTDEATEGNLGLTSLTGLALLPLLALVGGTGVLFGELWRAHFVVGLALVPVLGLKLVTTGYRAVRYYTGNRRYRAAGPPRPLARLLAPFLVAATCVAMVSGVVMWRQNNQDHPWSTIHTDSVAIMGLLVGIHVLLYLPRALVEGWHQARQAVRRRALPSLRTAVVLGILAAGIVLGFVLQTNAQFPARHRDRGEGLRVEVVTGSTARA